MIDVLNLIYCIENNYIDGESLPFNKLIDKIKQLNEKINKIE